jgi:hypothetical protein
MATENKPAAYPELDKLGDAYSDRMAIKNFLGYLRRRGFVLWEETTNRAGDWVYYPTYKNEDDLIMEALDIDPQQVEKERQALIASLGKS